MSTKGSLLSFFGPLSLPSCERALWVRPRLSAAPSPHLSRLLGASPVTAVPGTTLVIWRRLSGRSQAEGLRDAVHEQPIALADLRLRYPAGEFDGLV